MLPRCSCAKMRYSAPGETPIAAASSMMNAASWARAALSPEPPTPRQLAVGLALANAGIAATISMNPRIATTVSNVTVRLIASSPIPTRAFRPVPFP
jgi:hypothetical protein